MTTKVIERWLEKIEDDWRNPPLDYADENFQFMDYEIHHICQYPVPMKWHPEGESDCGEPSTRWVWWSNYNSGMYVCEEHFKHIERTEKEEKAKAND